MTMFTHRTGKQGYRNRSTLTHGPTNLISGRRDYIRKIEYMTSLHLLWIWRTQMGLMENDWGGKEDS